MNIQEKLRQWAEDAYEFYSKGARILDLDFYTQTLPNLQTTSPLS